MKHFLVVLVVCLIAAPLWGQVVTANQNLNNNFTAQNTFTSVVNMTGSVTMTAPTLSNVLGSTQCLHVDPFGRVSGTGADCGAGGGGGGGGNVTGSNLTLGVPILGSGGSSITTGPINLAGGNLYVVGVLPAANLPATSPQSVANDTNVTGSIAGQVLTLGWTGTLAAGRLNANVVQAITNDTNVTGSIAGQNLTLGWQGTLGKARTLATTVYTDQANTYTAGMKQSFTANATNASIRLTGVGADPSSLASFDYWCRSDTLHCLYYDGATKHVFMTQDDTIGLVQTPLTLAGQILYTNSVPVLAAFGPCANGTFMYYASGVPTCNPNITDAGGVLSVGEILSVNQLRVNGPFSLFSPAASSNVSPVGGQNGMAFFTDGNLYLSNGGAAFSKVSTTLDTVGDLAASKTFSDGNFPLTFNSATTTGTQVAFSIGETTASLGSGTVAISTLNGSKAAPLTITQGAGAVGSAAAPVLTVSGGLGGAAATTNSNGNNGAQISLAAGGASAGGATSGNGGIGGFVVINSGAGGAAVGGSTNGNGGNINLNLAPAGGGAGTAGEPGVLNVAQTGSGVIGANTTNLMSLFTNWNTSGSPTAIKLNVSNGGSGAASKFLDMQLSAVSKFAVDKNGVVVTYNGLATAGPGLSSVQAAPAVVVIGSGTSIGSTSICSTVLCPAGTYTMRAYLDITTPCGTSGTYSVSAVYTDDQGSKTFVIPIQGAGTAAGVLTTTSTSNFGEAAIVLRSTGAASINYLTTAVACGSAGPMVGNMYLSVTREM